MSAPAGLARELSASAARGEKLLVALDFDGTLACLRRRKGAARLSARRRSLLRALARASGVRVLIASGRSLSDLRARCRGLGAALFGDHGLRLEGLGARWSHPDLPRRAAQARRLGTAAAAAARGFPGVEVEIKEASVAVHYRRAAAVRRDPRGLKRLLERVLLPGWRVAGGKCVWEFRPRASWGKGEAVLLALKRLGSGWRAVFVGDDQTDEEGFETLGRRVWTAKVGRGRTAARWRLKGLADVDSLLSAALAARRQTPPTRTRAKSSMSRAPQR
jgi:trehalose-phosphatase